jgi:hypothetical protein
MRRLLIVAALVSLIFLTVTAAAEAATGTFDFTATLSADRTMATVTGTLSCNPIVSGSGVLTVKLHRVVGGLTIQGVGFSAPVTCTGTPQPWSVTAESGSAYVPGPANVTVEFQGECLGTCIPPVFDSWFQQGDVRLHP